MQESTTTISDWSRHCAPSIRDIVRTTECPTCQAGPGWPCENVKQAVEQMYGRRQPRKQRDPKAKFWKKRKKAEAPPSPRRLRYYHSVHRTRERLAAGLPGNRASERERAEQTGDWATWMRPAMQHTLAVACPKPTCQAPAGYPCTVTGYTFEEVKQRGFRPGLFMQHRVHRAREHALAGVTPKRKKRRKR